MNVKRTVAPPDAEVLPAEAMSRAMLTNKVRYTLRRIPGVALFQDASILAPSTPDGGSDPTDIGWPDVVGSMIARCDHGCRVPRPFAFLMMVPGEQIHAGTESWLIRLRSQGWVTAIVSDPDEAIEALANAAKVLAP